MEKVAQILLYPIKYNTQIKLVFVMIIIPSVFNGLQLWLTDNIIKKSTSEEIDPLDFTKRNNNLMSDNSQKI